MQLGDKKRDPVLFPNEFYNSNQKKPKPTSPTDGEWHPRFALVLLLVFGVLTLLISFVGEYGILSSYRLENQETELQQELQTLYFREQELIREVEALKTNPEYIESIARRELGLVRRGEIIYHFPEAEDTAEN